MSTEKKPNKLTEKAGLTFNVNTIKSKLKDYYEGQALTTPMFSGGHTALTASLEKLWEMLLQECLKKVGKDKSGVRQVNRELLQYSVLMHAGLRKYFVVHFENFDNTIEYRDQVPVISVEMDKVMERVDKDMSLTQKARNLACFMLLKVFSQMAFTCHTLIEHAKKKSLDGRCVMYVVNIMFHESVAAELHKEIKKVMKEFGEELEETHIDNETPTDNNNAVPAEEADTGDDDGAAKTTKGSTKDTKKDTSTKATGKGTSTKKKTEAIDEEEEDEDEEEAEEVSAKSNKKTGTAPKKPVTSNANKTAKKK